MFLSMREKTQINVTFPWEWNLRYSLCLNTMILRIPMFSKLSALLLSSTSSLSLSFSNWMQIRKCILEALFHYNKFSFLLVSIVNKYISFVQIFYLRYYVGVVGILPIKICTRLRNCSLLELIFIIIWNSR